MGPETDPASRSASGAVKSVRVGVPLWLVAMLVATAAGVSGYLGARWAMEGMWSELTVRPPVVLFDPVRTPPVLLQPGDQVRFVPVEEVARGA